MDRHRKFLQESLERAVGREDYEEAARIRDELAGVVRTDLEYTNVFKVPYARANAQELAQYEAPHRVNPVHEYAVRFSKELDRIIREEIAIIEGRPATEWDVKRNGLRVIDHRGMVEEFVYGSIVIVRVTYENWPPIIYRNSETG